MKKKQLIFNTVFILLLLAPNILFFLLKSHIDTKIFENKKLSERPTVSVENWNSYPRLYEDYYNDHLAFKNQFIKLNSIIDLNVFRKITSNRVLLGKDNWLFYKDKTDGDSISDYRGSNLFSQQQLVSVKNNLEKAEDYYKKKNIKFVLFIAPNKENIYSEYMPDTIKVINHTTRADQTVKYISENTNIPVIYPKAELLQTKKNNQVYYKYDTHWNQVGGFIGSQQLSEKLTGNRLYLSDIKISSTNKRSGDLAIMLNLSTYLNDDNQFSITGCHDDVKVNLIKQNDNINYLKYQSNASDKRMILIIRDSFSEAMFDYIPKTFATTVFIRRSDSNYSVIEQEKPDIVVYQIVERYTGSLNTVKFY